MTKQSEIAKKLKISPSHVSKILNGRTPIQDQHAEQLSRLMGCQNREELQKCFPNIRFLTYETYQVNIELKMQNDSFPSSKVSTLMRIIQTLKDLGVSVNIKIGVDIRNK
ncbi:MAG: hypothetical protein AUJ23_03185 [Candidatus Magasanikbacteria bacterium CG1_02_32_51]|uniref:HTH cro/C1-type domain-containing protein n=1 Tax=Candidatus Magasanikbacteria bacterium CG1_02_32_51 TaxID=1805238 RepID=A0A1J4U8V4_9BACT|nr:MAG: hypothetical protein AUJ23_03185 [Candidatus Magasanikbacteria bacterium CG1_02_32_51]